ncbi:outer membrane transport energization protein ExbD [Rhodobacter aestuarii]|uniref:Outer membrane transport energization protein ExbD n=1 Tax=Rhodobacter aestuarii TaxID=453582 RepID=A0A1N7P4J5_9RHOB|nr:biopolymer transporter ExbD [Rhodobacter aestuarii]PTV97575.1 outer membrane transport energization protein ExbD [Rhodobacter aestuarii]SIT05504.1 outer membrane transport energization protein ExbD [Rhodobacter aestuarii]
MEDDLSPSVGINLTPFIDVMLVLLIVFMVAAPLSTVDVPVDLPPASAIPMPRPAEPVLVSLQEDGQLMLGRNLVTAEDLPKRLAEAMARDPEARIYVSGDKAVPYGEMMRLLDTLRAEGFTRIGLVGLEQAP